MIDFWRNILALAMGLGLNVLNWVVENKALIMMLGLAAFDFIINLFS